jgi:hypothetical protein
MKYIVLPSIVPRRGACGISVVGGGAPIGLSTVIFGMATGPLDDAALFRCAYVWLLSIETLPTSPMHRTALAAIRDFMRNSSNDLIRVTP